MITPTLEVPSINDYILASLTLITILFVFIIAGIIREKGGPSWVVRKFGHVTISTIIALTLYFYSSFTGPIMVAISFCFFFAS